MSAAQAFSKQSIALRAQAVVDLIRDPTATARAAQALSMEGGIKPFTAELLLPLVHLPTTAPLAHVLALRPTWPHTTTNALRSEMLALPSATKTDMLRILLPLMRTATDTFYPCPSAQMPVARFFDDDTPTNNRRWMIMQFIPSLSIQPRSTAGRAMLQWVWEAALRPILPTTDHTAPSRVSVADMLGWIDGHQQTHPELAALPPPQECAAIRQGKGLRPWGQVAAVIHSALHRYTHDNPTRCAQLIRAMGAEHPTVLVWVAQHLAGSTVRYVALDDGRPARPDLLASHTALLVETLHSMPRPQAQELAVWWSSQTPNVPPTAAALAQATRLEAAVAPTSAPHRAPKM